MIRTGTRNRACGAVALGISMLGLSANTGAAPVFTDTFDGHSTGVWSSAQSPWTNLGGANESQDRVVEILNDTNNWFGQGTDNRIMMFSKEQQQNATLSLSAQDVWTGASLLTVSFDFYEPTVEGRTPAQTEPFAIFLGTGGASSSTLSAQLTFRHGTAVGESGAYNRDQAVRFDVVVNNAGTGSHASGTAGADAVYSHGGEEYTLAAGDAHVWVNGLLVNETGSAFTKTTSSVWGDISTIRLFYSSNATNLNTVYVDNMTVYDTAVIPEPGTAGLLIGAGLLLALRRFRR